MGGRKRSARGGREVEEGQIDRLDQEDLAAAMVTVAFPPRLVAMETSFACALTSRDRSSLGEGKQRRGQEGRQPEDSFFTHARFFSSFFPFHLFFFYKFNFSFISRKNLTPQFVDRTKRREPSKRIVIFGYKKRNCNLNHVDEMHNCDSKNCGYKSALVIRKMQIGIVEPLITRTSIIYH